MLHLLEMKNIRDEKEINKELAANFIGFYENSIGCVKRALMTIYCRYNES